MTVKAPPITEKEFLRQVTDLATRRGWSWVHFLPAMHKDNWRTPFQGPLGKGWPDLVLVRNFPEGGNSQIIFAELKAEHGRVTPDQQTVLDLLHNYSFERNTDTYVWRPSDWDAIMEALA